MNLDFKLVAYNSPQYSETVKLRDAILRKPLGLHFTDEKLAEEANQWHLAAYLNNELVACLILVPQQNSKIKMRQVAVAGKWQGKGIGQQLVTESERIAFEKNFTLMYCHARDEAVKFYQKLGYTTQGEPFTEVGIKHWLMEKVMR